MNEYLRWTRESTVELSRWLDERSVGHHFHDRSGGVVDSRDATVASLCLDAGDDDELNLSSEPWIVWHPVTRKVTAVSDTAFRAMFQVTL